MAMAGDDDKVLEIPSIDELLANAKRYQGPEHGGHAARHADSRREAWPPSAASSPAATAPAEGLDPAAGPESFDAASDDYKAYGWGGGRPHASLRLIFKDGSEKAIVYGHLDSHPLAGSEFLPALPGRKGNLIRLRISGQNCVFLVVIAGLFLRRVWELILLHQTPWIHELPAEAVALRPGEPVIWSIGFANVLDDAPARLEEHRPGE